MMHTLNTSVLVLGGGWSGLVAADLLLDRGYRVMVVEKEPVLGGLARTLAWQGYRYDIGGHRLYFRDSMCKQYIDVLLKDLPILTLSRTSKILFQNRLIDYPLSLQSFLAMKKRYLLQIGLDLFRSPRKQNTDTFEGWAKSRYGNTLFELIFREYTEKVWGRPCGEFSSVWADKRIGAFSVLRLLKDIAADYRVPDEDARTFYYPREGIGAVIEALERRISERGVISTSTVPLRFNVSQGRLVSCICQSGDKQVEIKFDQVVSTIPLVGLLPVLAASTGRDLGALTKGISYRSLVLVNIQLPGRCATKWHWCYFPERGLIFSRICEPRFWSPSLAPGNDGTLVSCEVFCNEADEVWNLDDAVLADMVVKGMQRAGIIGQKHNVSSYCVNRIPYAYPALYYGFEKALSAVHAEVASFGNLCLAGRNGTHSYLNMEECVKNVFDVVRVL